MGLRIKNFDILGVPWKIWLLGGQFTKNQYRGRDCLKRRGAWIVSRFKGGAWEEGGGWCFWKVGLIPRWTLLSLTGTNINQMIYLSFNGVNRLFMLSFENEASSTWHTVYYLPKVKTKKYNIQIDGRNFFVQPVKNDIKTYENIQKIVTGQEITIQLATY